MGKVKVKAWEGKVETPFRLASYMVDKLFRKAPPSPESRVLDPGCGRGVFIRAIISWCKEHGYEVPEVVGVELDPLLASEAFEIFKSVPKVKIVQGDFLAMSEDSLGAFDYVVSNPPYISYEKIDPRQREVYKKMFASAVGRFDTYILFFEKALKLLKDGGRLVFVTPEKYLYVLSASNLRKLLAKYTVEELELLSEDVFGNVLAYPAITVVRKTCGQNEELTLVKLRNGRSLTVTLPGDGSPWISSILGKGILTRSESLLRLGDIAVRISPGVATGCDEVFVVQRSALPRELEPFAYLTISGNELAMFKPGESVDYSKLKHAMLVPYSMDGELLDERSARPLVEYLSRYRARLESRYVVRTGKKKWHAFHEDPPLRDMLKPKILFPDIAREPAFYLDEKGLIVPRHTVYYIVPKSFIDIRELVKYLNSDRAKEWLKTHCQRAANEYLRLQTHVLKHLPLPEDLSYGLRTWVSGVGR